MRITPSEMLLIWEHGVRSDAFRPNRDRDHLQQVKRLHLFLPIRISNFLQKVLFQKNNLFRKFKNSSQVAYFRNYRNYSLSRTIIHVRLSSVQTFLKHDSTHSDTNNLSRDNLALFCVSIIF